MAICKSSGASTTSRSISQLAQQPARAEQRAARIVARDHDGSPMDLHAISFCAGRSGDELIEQVLGDFRRLCRAKLREQIRPARFLTGSRILESAFQFPPKAFERPDAHPRIRRRDDNGVLKIAPCTTLQSRTKAPPVTAGINARTKDAPCER